MIFVKIVVILWLVALALALIGWVVAYSIVLFARALSHLGTTEEAEVVG